ncbi:MAG: thiamine-phosphate kinase [Methanocellales archaeon]
MKVSEVGERAIVKRIKELINSKTIGDDCAFIESGRDYILITTDMLHRKTDFPREMTPWQIGWMSAAVNLSDIAAKGGKPIALLFSIGLPSDLELEFVEEMYRGMKACASKYDVEIAGGDTDQHEELTITGIAIGKINKKLLLRRSGARVGDLLGVTGYLGTCGAGMRIVINGVKAGMQARAKIVKKFFQPEPRIYEGMKLARSKALTSMMDISDGLAMSLYELHRANQGKVGFKVYAEKIPVLREVKLITRDEKDLLNLAIYTGGDFELLFTIKPEKLKKAQAACGFTIIGEVTKSKEIILEHKGREIIMQEIGSNHFKKLI